MALSTALARCTRAYNDSGTTKGGVLTLYESAVTTISAGAPTTGYTGVHLTVAAEKENSEKCATTISKDDYWIIRGVYADVLSKSTENIEMEFQIRLKDKVFRETFEFCCSTGNGTSRDFKPYIIVPKNSDIRMRAKSDGASTGDLIVSAGMYGVLAKIM